jgi:hypothetical protein
MELKVIWELSIYKMMNTQRQSMAICLCCVALFAQASTVMASDLPKTLENIASECSDRHGYNALVAGEVRQNTLHPNERQWAQCVYAAIESHIIPKSKIPFGYKELITRHRKLTDQVEGGTLSRNERRKQMSRLLSSLQNQEDALREPTKYGSRAPLASTRQNHHQQLLEMREQLRKAF